MQREPLLDGEEEERIPEIVYFYDFKCQQDTGVHKPNFLVVRWMCTECMDIPKDDEDRQKSTGKII